MKKILLSTLIFTFGITYCQAQSAKFSWANNIGSNNNDKGNAVTSDMADNAIVVSTFTDTADILTGPGTFAIKSNGMKDILITKYDRGGALMWYKAIGSPLDDEALGVATDALENIYVCGRFSVIADFNPPLGDGVLSATGGKDIFIVKFDPFGRFLWAKKMGGSATDEGTAINVDRFNNVYVAGNYWMSADLNPGVGISTFNAVGASDVFITRMDNFGNYYWSKSIGGDGIDASTSIANDRFGNVYVCGNYSGGGADFNPSAADYKLGTLGESDAFILKLNSAGSFVWAKQIGGPLTENATCVHVSDSDYVFVTGYFSGKVDFDLGTADSDTAYITASGTKDLFVAKLDLSGNMIWVKTLGTSDASCMSNSVKTDIKGNVVIGGSFTDSLDMDPSDTSKYMLYSKGGSDAFVCKLDPNGNFIWAKSFGDAANDEINAMASNMASSIFSTGSFGNTVDFNPAFDTFLVASNGNQDMFVQKLEYCIPSSRNIKDTLCAPLTLEGITYTKSGHYTQTVTGTSGCEEFLTMDLDIRNLNNAITVSGYVLTAEQTGVQYQWIGCKTKNEIPGATGRSYITLGNAEYAVTIFDGFCRDTSECYDMTAHPPLSVAEMNFQKLVQVYPNPSKGQFNIDCSPELLDAQANIFNILGQKVKSFTITNTTTSQELVSGFYLLEIVKGETKITRKIIIE